MTLTPPISSSGREIESIFIFWEANSIRLRRISSFRKRNLYVKPYLTYIGLCKIKNMKTLPGDSHVGEQHELLDESVGVLVLVELEPVRQTRLGIQRKAKLQQFKIIF